MACTNRVHKASAKARTKHHTCHPNKPQISYSGIWAKVLKETISKILYLT